jgi:hypothetical protein
MGLAAGLVLVTSAAWLASLALFMIGGALAGGGAGSAFKASVSTVLGLAPAHMRGEALAGLFLASYLGLSVPVIALGLATQYFSARATLLGFAAILLAVVALVARRVKGDGARRP